MTDETEPPPPPPRPRGRLLAFGVLLATFLLATGGALDRMRAGARRVFVVNGTPHAQRVEVGDQAVEVPPGESRVLFLAEGNHTAEVAALGSGAAPRPQELTIESDLLSRHLAREVFVLNIDGAAALVKEVARRDGTGGTSLLFGPFLRVRGVDYAFQRFPDQLQGTSRVRLGIAPGPPASVLAAASTQRIGAALAWAEQRLRPGALDPALLATYARRAAAADPARGVKFLSVGLDHRPLSIPWHRAYQTVRLQVASRADVEREYQARLEAAPREDASALHYLLGRVAPDEATALRRYQEAIDADGQNAFAWFGKAVRLFRRGELDEAQRHAERAARLRPRDGEMARLLLEVRIARGDLEPARATLTAWLKQRPTDLGLERQLLEVLCAANDLTAAREQHQAFRTGLSDRRDPQQRGLLSELALFYLEGKYEEQLTRAGGLNDLRRRARVELEALIELDRLDDAEQRLAAAGDPDAELALAIAWRFADLSRAAPHRAAARALLAKGGRGDQAAAALLERAHAPVDAILPLAVAPARKALLLLWLAPDAERARALELAERFNFGRLFPHAFVVRAIAKERG